MCPQCLVGSHVLPGFIHWLNVLFGLHPECCDAGASVILHRAFVIEDGWALVGRGADGLHTLNSARWAVEEAVARVGGLQALRWSHKARYGVHGRGTGDGRGEPRIQGHRVAHRPHAGGHLGPVERQHGRIGELHGAGVHLFLTSPLGSSVLEPHLDAEEWKWEH